VEAVWHFTTPPTSSDNAINEDRNNSGEKGQNGLD
jgi:hypothetical protein